MYTASTVGSYMVCIFLIFVIIIRGNYYVNYQAECACVCMKLYSHILNWREGWGQVLGVHDRIIYMELSNDVSGNVYCIGELVLAEP